MKMYSGSHLLFLHVIVVSLGHFTNSFGSFRREQRWVGNLGGGVDIYPLHFKSSFILLKWGMSAVQTFLKSRIDAWPRPR